MQEYIRGYQVTVIPSGALGWFDFYINGKPRGCTRASQLAKRITEVIDDKEAAKYQPQIVLDAITNALGK